MNKKRAIQILTECAKQYDRNLKGRHLLFVFGNPQRPSAFNASFYETHFLHLTGVISRLNPSMFYSACLNGKLKETDFGFRPNGTTEQKLDVLPYIMEIQRNANTIADFGKTGFALNTDKVVGNSTATIGFWAAGENNYPNTVLKGNIKMFGQVPYYKILAILRKSIGKKESYEVFGLMRGVDEDDLVKRLNAQGIEVKV